MARLISRSLHLSRLLGSSLFAVIIAFGQGAWAQSLAAPEKEIRAEDATVTGGILRTPLYKDSVMLNPATGLEETVPAMRVVKIHQQAHLLVVSNTFTTTSTNLDEDDDFIFGGSDEGYTGGAR